MTLLQKIDGWYFYKNTNEEIIAEKETPEGKVWVERFDGLECDENCSWYDLVQDLYEELVNRRFSHE